MAEANSVDATTVVLGDKFCVHITNLCSDISGKELSDMFSFNIELVLIDTVKKEAWIKNIHRKDTAETKARACNGKLINNQPITCRAIQELIHISKLCPYFRNGNCDYGNRCSQQHVWCQNRDTCSDEACYYGHTLKRPFVQSLPVDYNDPTIEYYRIKITGLPMGTTVALLEEKMGRKSKGQYVIFQNQTSTMASTGTIAYLRRQPSEKMAQLSIKQWQKNEYFPGFKLQYQLEIDHNNINEKAAELNLANIQKNDDRDLVELSQDVLSNSQLPTEQNSQSEYNVMIEEKHLIDNLPTAESDFQFPKDLQKKNEWKYTGKILGTTGTGQGEVYLIRQISEPYKEAALKVYKRTDEKVKRMRSYREMIALRTMEKGGVNVVSNVTSLIDTNIDGNFKKAMDDTNVPWIILSLAPGCSLTDFINKSQRDIGFREAIIFCIKLLNITKSFHACGIVHRDLKPDNIHIDCQNNDSLEQGNTTVLDFGLAYIQHSQLPDDCDLDGVESKRSENDFATNTGTEIGNRWYRVPQLTPQKTAGLTEMQKNQIIQQRRSPSIDASSVCAILYWFLTKEIPGEDHAKNHEPPPHRKIGRDKRSIWNNVVQQAVNKERSKCSKARLERYLLDTFDRGFADAIHQWTIDQLLCHLNIMCNCLDEDTNADRQLLNPISDLISALRLSPFFDRFSCAAHIFEFAKIHFVQKVCSASAICHWAMKNKFRWIDELAIHQRTNVDLLHYYDENGIMWTIEVYCLAKIDEEMNINLFVGSIVDGLNIQLPIYTLSRQEMADVSKQVTHQAETTSLNNTKLQDLINDIFLEELRTLIYKFHQKKTR